jgi:hypothetical protein
LVIWLIYWSEDLQGQRWGHRVLQSRRHSQKMDKVWRTMQQSTWQQRTTTHNNNDKQWRQTKTATNHSDKTLQKLNNQLWKNVKMLNVTAWRTTAQLTTTIKDNVTKIALVWHH